MRKIVVLMFITFGSLFAKQTLLITPKDNSNSFQEGSHRDTNTTHIVKLQLSRALISSDIGGETATLHYKLEDGTAVGDKKDAIGVDGICPCKKADYIPASKDITIKEGDTEIDIPVVISEDGFFELDEDFYIKLSLDGGDDVLNTKYKVTIQNDDELRVGVNYSIANEVQGTIDFLVEASTFIPKGYGNIRIYYKTSPANETKEKKAEANLDYIEVTESENKSVVIKEGEIGTYIKIKLIDDQIDEERESFKLVLTKAEKATIYEPEKSVDGFIEDNDYKTSDKASYLITDPNKSVIQTKVINHTYDIHIKGEGGISIPFEKRVYSCSSCGGCSLSSKQTGLRYDGIDQNGDDLFVQREINKNIFYAKKTLKSFPKYIAVVEDNDNINLSCSGGGGGGGGSCAACAPPCTYWTEVRYTYSTRMTISKVTLEGYSNYDSSSGQCSGTREITPLDLNSIKYISDNETKILKLKPTKSYRCARIKVEGRSDTDYTQKKNTSVPFIAYSDLFSTRPAEFILVDKKADTTESKYSTTNPIIAGEPIQLYIKTLGEGKTTIPGYSEDITKIYSIKDAKYSTVKEFGFNYTNYSGANDLAYSTYDAKTTYKEAGDLTITLKEDTTHPYAEVDKGDGTPDSELYIPTYTKRFRVIPDRFDITYTNHSNKNNSSDITFIANEIDNMHSYVDFKIEAKEKGGAITTRYESAGYSYDTNLTIKNHIVTQNSGSQTLQLKRVSNADDKNTTISTSENTTFKLKKAEFSAGILKDRILLNFNRKKDTALEPIQLFTDGFDLVETDGISGHLVTGNNTDTTNTKHYYTRVHAPSPQSEAGTELDAKVYYEVYCKSCDKSNFVLAKGQSSIDEIYWYILPHSVYSQLMTNTPNNFTFDSFSTTANIKSHDYKGAGSNDYEIYHIEINKAPDKNRVYYHSYPYLMYNRFNATIAKHSFDIVFTYASNNWAGRGTKGTTVDTNISQINNQSLEW